MISAITNDHQNDTSNHLHFCISRGSRSLVLVAICLMSFADKAVAQYTTLCLGFDQGGVNEIPVPGNFYVGDQNDLFIQPGKNPLGRTLQSVVWTVELTTFDGWNATFFFASTNMFGYQYLAGQLGIVKITADFSYSPDSGNPNPPPTTASVTFSISPPTAIVYMANMSPTHTPGQDFHYNIADAHGEYVFHIVGGQTNNGYNMKVQEKIFCTIPPTGAQFGGAWVWDTNGAPGLTMDTTGKIVDVKECNNGVDNQNVGNGGTLLQYTQTLGVKVGKVDNTLTDIVLGTFTFKIIRLSATQCTFSLE